MKITHEVQRLAADVEKEDELKLTGNGGSSGFDLLVGASDTLKPKVLIRHISYMQLRALLRQLVEQIT